MSDLDFTGMLEMQRELQEKYREKWDGLSPEKAVSKLLWLYGELGEAGDIIKKKGINDIMQREDVRGDFVEELCDVMMYFNDIMLCFSITPEELSRAYINKHERNMTRW